MDTVAGLQLFIRVVETGSFSKASADQGITQPTATKHVAALEKRLGARLFHRSTRGVTPTEVGALYYEKCKVIARQLEEADSLAALMSQVLRPNPAVGFLDSAVRAKTGALRGAIGRLRRTLASSAYGVTSEPIGNGEVGITPLLGFGARRNQLNAVILQLIQRAERRLVLYTPYFNLPGPVRLAIEERLKRRCHVTIVLGDKTANDFYMPPEEPFTTICALPYLYASNLRRFCKAHQKAVDQGLLDLHLWRHENHSFHLKGLLVDDDYALITGSNINPRAWRLDLENGLLIHDPQSRLIEQHWVEVERILAHTRRLEHHQALEAADTYPLPVQRLLKRLARTRADRLVNQVL